ncbi:MAG: AmmeMemoRadiSam system radical SAM enzyme [Desulfosudaceae bacterium]
MRQAMLYEKQKEGKVHCFLCAHHCGLEPGQWGRCQVRENREGDLYTHAWGEVIAANVDVIEKKPLYHFLPGSRSFSIATAGCNFKCSFCQNWQISQIQAGRDDSRRHLKLEPAEIVRRARQSNCRSISYTYTEPTIFFEYAYDTAQIAGAEGLANVFVSNGFMTEQALDTIAPWLDAINVDLKSFQKEFYKDICQGRLTPVLDTIRRLKERNIWTEVTTLIVPGQNDSEEELGEMASFLASVDPEMPWHLSRFHPDYQYDGVEPTPLSTLERAWSLAKENGLQYVYLGNIPSGSKDTLCPACEQVVISRGGFEIKNMLQDGACPDCGQKIKGVF